MKIQIANSIENAIKIPCDVYKESQAEQLVNFEINKIFGSLNGDFFILNETNRKDMKGRTFKIIYVEDKDEDRHTLYFQLIKP